MVDAALQRSERRADIPTESARSRVGQVA
jgi:hypothetical protein